MDYGAIISVAAFFVAIQMAARTNVKPLILASIAVLIPYIVTLVTKYILATGSNLPVLANLFSVGSVITIIIQFVASAYILKRIQDDDTLLSVFMWGVGGLLAVLLFIPVLVKLVWA